MLTPLIREIERVFPGARIDLVLRGGAGRLIFREFNCIGRILELPKRPLKQPVATLGMIRSLRRRRYDLAFNVQAESSLGRLATRISRARHKRHAARMGQAFSRPGNVEHMGRKPVSVLRHFLSEEDGGTREIPTLCMPLTEAEASAGQSALEELVECDRPVICLYTHATGPKRYGAVWWRRFQQALAERLPDAQMVEALPVENISQLDFRLPSYYSRNIRDLGAFIAACDLFVAADNGVMHLASSVGTTTVGLFRASSCRKYAPYGGRNIGIETENLPLADLVEAVAGRLTRDDDQAGEARVVRAERHRD